MPYPYVFRIDRHRSREWEVVSAYFEYYKVFYHVANCRSITGAAEKLSLTQPSVTRAIKSLESQLGLTLFLRSKQGVMLTPEGQRLYDRIAPACEQFFAAEEELSHIKDMELGQIRFSVDPIIMRSDYFLEKLRIFREKHPRIFIKMEHSRPSLLKDASLGGLDFCFFSALSELDMVPGLTVQTLFSYENVLVVGQKFASFAGRELTEHDLALIPAIVFDQEDFPLPLDPTAYPAESAALDVSTMDSQRQLTKAGFGYTLIPRLCVEDELQRGELLALDLKDFPLQCTMTLITPNTRPLSHAAQEFVQLFTPDTAAELI